MPNYSSASQYLVADDSGNIGWRDVTQGKTYDLANASTYGVMCLYSRTGNNTDGTMTQAAITEAINNAGGAVIMPERDYTYLDLLLILDIIQDIPQIFMKEAIAIITHFVRH